jgi:hypothetical protein
MIIERIPDFLISPDDYIDSFVFDQSGRFIFNRRHPFQEESDVTFFVYDILFNNYIELTASNSNPNIPVDNRIDNIWKEMNYFLPISVEQILTILRNGETDLLLILLNFDLHEKVYKIADYVKILKCQFEEFVRDGVIFGIFYKSSTDGEFVGVPNNNDSFFMLRNFTIQENRIILGKEKKFNFKPLNSWDYPLDFNLRSNKLWYIRKKSQVIVPALPPQARHLYTPPVEDPTSRNLRICYFDLNEDLPSENFVDEIQIEESQISLILKWLHDSLLLLHFGTKFDVLNLLTFEWTSKALDSGIDFTNLDENGERQAEETWIEFHCSKNEYAYWAGFSSVHIDDDHVITAVNRKTSSLHRIPLKEPLKLSMIAWICAFNAGLIQENTNLPPNLPYSRVL